MRLSRRDALAGIATAVVGCSAPASDGSEPSRRRRRSSFGASHTVDGTARLGFVGDLMLARYVEQRHHAAPAAVWHGFENRLHGLDGLIGNLECPLTARGEPWPDKQWRFRATPSWAAKVLDAGNVSAVSLANNHMMDYGPVSVRDTVDALDTAGIAHAGAGPDLATAFAPTTFTAGDLTVAMVSYTDRFRPFAAGPTSPGTAYANPAGSDRAVRQHVEADLAQIPESVDLVVASLHWGPNYEPKTDTHRAFGRWLIDQGVDVVHGHSAHEVAGIEVYEGRPILYDTGTFVSDFAPVEGHRNDLTFLFELVVEDGLDALRLHPVKVVAASVRPARQRGRLWLQNRVRSQSARFETAVRASENGRSLAVSL